MPVPAGEAVRGAPGARDATVTAARSGRRTRAVLLALLALASLPVTACRDDRVAATPASAAPAAPALVFVHGLGGSPADWLDVANALGRDHRVVLEALPGHAHSPMVDSLPLATAAVDVARRARALGGPVVIVGHSIGGAVAVRAALLDSANVVGLVLVETALKPQLPPAERAGVRRAFRVDYASAVREVYANFASNRRQANELAREAGSLDPHAFAAWLDDALHEDLVERAAALHVPVLVVLSPRSWPEAEPWSATAESLGYAHVANVTPVRIASSAHFVMLDRPAQLEAAIRAWLPGVAARRR
jgi:pimeloyl-ACP methyl ester carboxylesterase